jgi:hypothetical protein
MITETADVLVKDKRLYFTHYGIDELRGESTIGPIILGPVLGSDDETIGAAILRNLIPPRILTAEENEDIKKFERACQEIGFRNSDDFYRRGLLVPIYIFKKDLFLVPTKSRGKRSISFEFKEKVKAEKTDPLSVGRLFREVLYQCS